MEYNLEGKVFRSVSNTDNGEVGAGTRYHHLNDKGDFMLGKCLSTPERLPDGRLRFKEQWQWLSGDMSAGSSEIEEVLPDAAREGKE